MHQTILTALLLINGRRAGHAHMLRLRFKGPVTSKRRKSYGAKESSIPHTLSCGGSLRRRILKSRQQPPPAVSSEEIMDKPFAKTEQKVLTVTIDEEGNLVYLKTSEHDIFAELGEVVTKRASHVEPVNIWLRVAFRFLRVFGDKTRVAEWTRTWTCDWRVNTKPTAGYLLPQSWRNRQDAIDAEIAFLNEWFIRGEHAIQEQERQAEERR